MMGRKGEKEGETEVRQKRCRGSRRVHRGKRGKVLRTKWSLEGVAARRIRIQRKGKL